jgi:tetratricopeptide (TPR) repeat protein
MSRRAVLPLSAFLLSFVIPFLPICAQVPATSSPSSAPLAAAPVVPATAPATPRASAFAKAQQLYRTGKLSDAENDYKTLIEQDPQSALAYVGLVRVYLKQKRLSDASTAAAKAIELAPPLSAVHVAMGEVYFRQAKMDEAEKEFLKEIKRGTRDARAYLGMARLYAAFSFHKSAKQMIDRAYELDPADPDIRKAWMGTLSFAESIKALQTYLAGETNDDAEVHADLEHELTVLQDRENQPNPSCRLRTKISATSINLATLWSSARHFRGAGLIAKLNGTSAVLLLDTGASGILVNGKIAEKAGIKRVVQTDIRGIGDKGSASGYVGFADSVRIGDLEFQGCYVEVSDKKFRTGEEGLIGADIFDHYLVDIDFPDNKLKLSQLPPRPGESAKEPATDSDAAAVPRFYDQYIAPAMKSYTPILRFGHDLLIPTRVNDSDPVLFLIDSGAFDDMISPKFARESTGVSGDSDTTVKGINGVVNKVYRADAVNLQFSHFKHDRKGLVSFDTSLISDGAGTEIAGILGFAMLHLLDVKIDYRDGLVDFQFDPDRFH